MPRTHACLRQLLFKVLKAIARLRSLPLHRLQAQPLGSNGRADGVGLLRSHGVLRIATLSRLGWSTLKYAGQRQLACCAEAFW